MTLFRKSISSLTLSLFFALAANARQSDSYTLNYSAEHPARITVEATITLEDSLLYMSPYGSKASRFPAYVHELHVTDISGRNIPVEFRDSLQWIVKGAKTGTPIHLSYQVYVEHEQEAWPGGTDGIAYKRDYGTMTSGRVLFIINGAEKKDILVTPELPDTWKVSVPWKLHPDQPGVYQVPNLAALQESFVFAGTHREILVKREDFTLKFVLGGENLYAQEPQITAMANELLDYYIELMGGIPKPDPKEKINQAMVIITENEITDGEVIGNHISMFMNPNGDPQSQMIGWFIFAHEFYHLWNGKSIKFEGSGSDWFKEGVSNYYTLKGLYTVGFLKEESYKAVLNNLFYQRYINDPGLGEMSPVASADGFSKDRHWGLIYGGGLFAGIAADMEIRTHSENQKSLDDLMKDLFQNSVRNPVFYNNDDLIAKIQAYGFAAFPEFFENHLKGTEVISLAPYLKHAGVDVSTANGQLTIEHQPEKSEMEAAIWEGFLGAR
ncbi:M61 family metallopeptidase [Robertkochia flava]|uniref:M61 family metallopeptidase n=1 Tax=Robertkochia flava TaxID=3447986 RepID=UPI001CCFE053|nr:hypothetical protein [Robertkochia marina]